jgi:hypothetical protein
MIWAGTAHLDNSKKYDRRVKEVLSFLDFLNRESQFMNARPIVEPIGLVLRAVLRVAERFRFVAKPSIASAARVIFSVARFDDKNRAAAFVIMLNAHCRCSVAFVLRSLGFDHCHAQMVKPSLCGHLSDVFAITANSIQSGKIGSFEAQQFHGFKKLSVHIVLLDLFKAHLRCSVALIVLMVLAV